MCSKFLSPVMRSLMLPTEHTLVRCWLAVSKSMAAKFFIRKSFSKKSIKASLKD